MSWTLSAIVPTWNEAENIAETLRGLRAGGVDEILLVDGGSVDETVERARGLADRIFVVSGGLFAQLDAGAREARGDILLFHYADGRFPAGGGESLRGALSERGVAGGAFTLGFQSDRLRYQVVAWGARWRNRLGIGPFGDQTLFLFTGAYHALRGFCLDAPLPDLDLVRRLRRLGKFRIVGERVLTSVRRWEERGLVPTLLLHWWLTFTCVAGFHESARKGGHAAERLRLRGSRPHPAADPDAL